MYTEINLSEDRIQQIKASYPILTNLILNSLLLPNYDPKSNINKTFFLDNLENMDDIQISRLYDILQDERVRIKLITEKFNKLFINTLKTHLL